MRGIKAKTYLSDSDSNFSEHSDVKPAKIDQYTRYLKDVVKNKESRMKKLEELTTKKKNNKVIGSTDSDFDEKNFIKLI